MSVESREDGYVLLWSCKNAPGIVAAVSTHLYDQGFNIRASQQFDDPSSGHLFMRLHVNDFTDTNSDLEQVRADFAPVAERFEMQWTLQRANYRARVLIMVSRFSHCLNDLLYRTYIGAMNIEIPAVVSNHPDCQGMAEHYGVRFHHVPVTPETKPEAEQRLLEIIAAERIDLTVLARYMQVLSPDLSRELAGRAINIHHSMLPSFKGARPYHQAHDRGVKVVGATAHYVTDDLDEGPIIEQEIARIDHTMSTAEITAVGRDTECQALSRAVLWHTENRVALNGQRTVVFR